jgi:hypothetical protein
MACIRCALLRPCPEHCSCQACRLAIPSTTPQQAFAEADRLIKGGQPSRGWCYDSRCMLLGSASEKLGTVRLPTPHHRHATLCPLPGEDSRAYHERLTEALA